MVSFAEFLKDKAAVWSGQSTNEYAEVDRHHALQAQAGNQADQMTSTGSSDLEDAGLKGKVMDSYPEFGKGMLKYWKFAKGCECYQSILQNSTNRPNRCEPKPRYNLPVSLNISPADSLIQEVTVHPLFP
jgi:hypothetical protein